VVLLWDQWEEDRWEGGRWEGDLALEVLVLEAPVLEVQIWEDQEWEDQEWEGQEWEGQEWEDLEWEWGEDGELLPPSRRLLPVLEGHHCGHSLEDGHQECRTYPIPGFLMGRDSTKLAHSPSGSIVSRFPVCFVLL
jgi:hypothetical protein